MTDDVSPAAQALDDALEAAADHASESAREYAQAMKASLGTALDRKYTSEALAKDMAGFWARGMRDWARAWKDLTVVANAVADLPSSPAPTPPPPPTAPTAPPPAPPAGPAGKTTGPSA